MSRPCRSGPLSFFTPSLAICSPLSSTLSRYISLLSTLPASSALVYTLASPFVHVLSGHCVRGIIGRVLSKFARDCAPFEAHLIDRVLMKMIPLVTSVARCVPFIATHDGERDVICSHLAYRTLSGCQFIVNAG